MKLNARWIVWFGAIGVYVMLLGGIFYYNLFKWTFDEKLKSDVLEMVRLKSPELMDGLLKKAGAITFDEYDVIEFLRNDRRIADILYLDGNGRIRWFRHGKYLGKDFDTFVGETSYDATSIWQAYRTGTPAVVSVKKQPFYDMAIPFKAKGEDIIGILNLRVSREGARSVISSAMRKYIFGAFGVLVLLGVPLWFFLKFYVVNPVNSLADSIDGISSKKFEIKFGSRNDEIGYLAQSVAGFLERVREELDFAYEQKEGQLKYEQTWWEVVLSTVASEGTKAVVVDEDNNVLFANFPLKRLDPKQKLHLLDVIDTDNKDIVKLVGMAMESPKKLISANTVFKSEPVYVKVMQVEPQGRPKRTLVVLEKRNV